VCRWFDSKLNISVYIFEYSSKKYFLHNKNYFNERKNGL
jgi:hypothetical protein